MSLGKNIQYLRKQKRIPQEQLAEIMSVSRQTISRWEADEIIPELDKLVALSDLFACRLDALVKEDMPAFDEIYSTISIRHVKAFRMLTKSCWIFYRQTDFAKSQRMISCPVLNMCTKRKE